MTSPQISEPNSPAGRGEVTATSALVLPTATQAVIYLAFGALTIFWQEPTLTVLTITTGVSMLALGVNTVFTGTRVRPVSQQLAGGLNSIGMILAAAAVLMLVLEASLLGVSLITAIALGVAFILKSLLATVSRVNLAVARDWQLEGIIMVATGLSTLLTAGIGVKAVLGTLGGGAIISGVFLTIGALTLAAESKKSSAI